MWLHFYILKYKSSVHLVIRLFWLLSYNSVVILIWSWEVSIVYLLCYLEQKLQFYNLLILALLICVLYIIMVLIFIP